MLTAFKWTTSYFWSVQGNSTVSLFYISRSLYTGGMVITPSYSTRYSFYIPLFFFCIYRRFLLTLQTLFTLCCSPCYLSLWCLLYFWISALIPLPNGLVGWVGHQETFCDDKEPVTIIIKKPQLPTWTEVSVKGSSSKIKCHTLWKVSY